MTAALALGLAGSYLALLLGKWWLARRRLREAPAVMAKAQMAQVTVLQPILAGDPGLAAILAEQLAALPEASFRWLVDDDDSEAQRIVAALAPPTACRVLRGRSPRAWAGTASPARSRRAKTSWWRR